MKTINESFEGNENDKLEELKKLCGVPWKELLMGLAEVCDRRKLKEYFYLKRQKENK